MVPLRNAELEVRHSVHVSAASTNGVEQILTAKSIQTNELPISLTHFIGVPKPMEGINVLTPEGEVRYSTWERRRELRGRVTDRRDNESITWKYVFDSHSFPGRLDGRTRRYLAGVISTCTIRPSICTACLVDTLDLK